MGPVGVVHESKGCATSVDAIAQIAAHHHDLGEARRRKGAQLPAQNRLSCYAHHTLGNLPGFWSQAPAAASRHDDDLAAAHAALLHSLRMTARIVRPA